MLWPSPGCSIEGDAVAAELSPGACRALDTTLLARFSPRRLQERLPLRWPTPPGTPPSPKKAYHSFYTYLGWEDWCQPGAWKSSSEFDLLLRLVDFSGLRPVLAQLLGWNSGRGWKPFDPVSLFLLVGWQIVNHWTRTQTLRNLRAPRYADYARRFGFRNDRYPTEGGVRHFLTTLGRPSSSADTICVDEKQPIRIAVQRLNQLIAQSVRLIQEAGLISPTAWEKALVCPDGMLHPAASAPRCNAVTQPCYQPTSPHSPRPCAAKEKDRRGCNCDTAACAQMCRHATPRDPLARFVWYSGSNEDHDSPNRPTTEAAASPPKGKGVYGYRSLPLQLADPLRRFSLILLDDFRPANEREENPASALLLQLHTHYPDLHPDAVAGDAGFGYDLPLRIIHEKLQARRVVDLRSHPTDKDKGQWSVRGYDDKGRPVCPYGYRFQSNGFDSQRRRHKWICARACRNGASPVLELPNGIYPPPECPYQGTEHPHGQVINVGKRFKDGSIRLVRDLPVGSSEWKRLYHRARNAVESRNATLERWGLKRLPVYGDPRGRATVFQADVWYNLTTMARLMREAALAAGAT
jgi:hypothetical protein